MVIRCSGKDGTGPITLWLTHRVSVTLLLSSLKETHLSADEGRALNHDPCCHLEEQLH